MLKPPGSARATSRSSSKYASGRRKTMESPTDQLRKIAKRDPSNKKCCDCQAKIPQCINLSVGSFICMTCSGLHREINSKIKSLGHSTFTEGEVEMMKQTSNDRVNSVWLARYDPQKERSRLNQQPNGNQDQEHLRTWIRRKYKDKRWYSSDGTAGGGNSANQNTKSGQRGSAPVSASRQPQATVAPMPPVNPPADLLGAFDAPAPAAVGAPSPQNGGWDAFGGSSHQQQNSNFAGFGNGTNSTPDPFAQPAKQQPPQQQQQQNFANFGSTDPFAQQPQPQPQPQQQPQAQNQGFANFNQQQPPPQQQQQFANFSGQQLPQQPPPPQQQTQNVANFGNQNSQQQQPREGFANFNQQQQPPRQHPQPPQQPVPQQAGVFADFNQQQQMMTPQQQQMGNAAPSGGGFANFNQQQVPEQQVQQQKQQPAAQQGAGFAANFNQQQPAPTQTHTQPIAVQESGPEPQASQEQQPPMQAQQQAMPTLMAAKEDPMDAFAHLSVAGDNSNGSNNSQPMTMNHPAVKSDVSQIKSNDSSTVQYEAMQIVCYKSNGKRSKAKILKKHVDDDLQPYYSIMLPFGKEKQTDNAHLEPLDPAFEKLESMLLSLSTAQLKQVDYFLSNNMTTDTSSGLGGSPTDPGPAMQMPLAGDTKTNNQAPAIMASSNSITMGGTMGQTVMPAAMMNRASSNASVSSNPLPEARPPVPNMGVKQPNLQQYQQQPQMQGKMKGSNPAPQMMTQQQHHSMQGHQPPQMQGQAGGQQFPRMQMQQQPLQGQDLPKMQGQVGGQQLPQMQMQQQPLQGQNPPQMQGQASGQQLPQMQMGNNNLCKVKGNSLLKCKVKSVDSNFHRCRCNSSHCKDRILLNCRVKPVDSNFHRCRCNSSHCKNRILLNCKVMPADSNFRRCRCNNHL
uniref:Arf-GAP domain-containing protein n=1 Tax=Pseudo-nitzschia australis TaxID=44445 RepID=A0A7S4AUA6_9STRA